MGKKDNSRDIVGVLKFTTALDVSSFITANILLFGMFFYLFDTLWYYKLAIGVIISVLNFLIIKTDLMLAFKRSEKKKEYPFLSLIPEDTKINLSKFILSCVMTRYFVFNVISDMFPSFLGWIGIYGILIILPLNGISLAYSPSLIGILLTGVGIIMGIFQFYKKYYVDEIIISWTSTLDGYFKRHLGKLSYSQFLDYLKKCEKWKWLFREIQNKYDELVFLFKLRKITGKNVNPVILYTTNEDIIVQFIESRFEEDKNKTTIMDDLRNAYADFFGEEIKKIKKDIDKQDLSKLRAKYIANIFLFNTLVSKLSETPYAIKKKIEKPESFAEFRLNAVYEVIGYFIKKMLRGETSDE